MAPRIGIGLKGLFFPNNNPWSFFFPFPVFLSLPVFFPIPIVSPQSPYTGGGYIGNCPPDCGR